MKTLSLLLNTYTWDITLDDKGNLAVVENPYAVTQDVACACSTFAGEVWYDITLGVPYFEKILGHQPGSNIVQSYLEKQALTLNHVKQATATVIKNNTTRASSGVITIVDTNGTTSTINL